MKKFKLKATIPKDSKIIELIKESGKLNCRIQIDIENGIITVENIEDSKINNVISMVSKYYDISGIDIDNSSPDKSDSFNLSNQPQQKKVAIKKMNFKDEQIESAINKFIRTIDWAINKMNIPEDKLVKFIYTSMDEISWEYNKRSPIDFSVGDIVDANYGLHLSEEVNGSHVHAIVCDIMPNGVAYLVPIIKASKNISARSYLSLPDNNEITYLDGITYKGNTLLFDKGKYVRCERISKVVGKASTDFMKKVLEKLATAFDFTQMYKNQNNNLQN